MVPFTVSKVTLLFNCIPPVEKLPDGKNTSPPPFAADESIAFCLIEVINPGWLGVMVIFIGAVFATAHAIEKNEAVISKHLRTANFLTFSVDVYFIVCFFRDYFFVCKELRC